METVSHSLLALQEVFDRLPSIITELISVEILTEMESDQEILDDLEIEYHVDLMVVPDNYETRNKTKYKARALHYLIEKRSNLNSNLQKDYIIHFDAESVIGHAALISILNSVLNNPDKLILQGPIVYPSSWFQAGLLSRQMESLRPWNCYECYSETKNGIPYHLHGSNIVIRADIEYEIGWDFGQIYDYPVVAEDLFFGIKAYLMYGADIFGWHGAEMREQPALRLIDSLKQRERWIKGTLQALSVVPTWEEYSSHDSSIKHKFRIRLWFKLLFYGLGFIPSLFLNLSIFFGVLNFVLNFIPIANGSLTQNFVDAFMFQIMPMVPRWMLHISLLGAILWLLTIQIGLHHNIKSLELSWWKNFKEHLVVLLITPIATVFDTGVVFFTTIFWLLGRKEASWSVTPKSSEKLKADSTLFS